MAMSLNSARTSDIIYNGIQQMRRGVRQTLPADYALPDRLQTAAIKMLPASDFPKLN